MNKAQLVDVIQKEMGKSARPRRSGRWMRCCVRSVGACMVVGGWNSSVSGRSA
jgi:hypothetical protein